jgi:two-component system CheB/CheR fusion protein
VLPYRAPDSSVDGTLITFVDVTSIVEAEQHQRLLVDELNHRVKNMLTVVISLASQTLRRAGSLDEFSNVFMGRLDALTASYSLLSSANWNEVSLLDVLVEETRPFLARDRRNILFAGPEVRLGPQRALALGMAAHELATNAVKHGALSVPQGTVAISWQIEQGAGTPELVLQWREFGGPAVLPPVRRGFGTMLIEKGFAHELSGSATIQFDAAGVMATLRAPLGTPLGTPLSAPMVAPPSAVPGVPSGGGSGRTVGETVGQT